jgi:hypothetical protein
MRLLNLTRQATVSSIDKGQWVTRGSAGYVAEEHPEVALRMVQDLASRLADISRKFMEKYF